MWLRVFGALTVVGDGGDGGRFKNNIPYIYSVFFVYSAFSLFDVNEWLAAKRSSDASILLVLVTSG